MARYHFYCDDSGTKDPNDFNTNNFAYAGIIIAEEDIKNTEDELRKVKARYFNGHFPEIKSHWLRRTEERKPIYLDKYNISERKLCNFVNAFYEKISELPIRVMGVVIDKKRLRQKYSQYLLHPSEICYEFLLQRIANYATQYTIGKVSFFMDDMTGKSPEGNEWKKLLVSQHETLLAGKSPFYRTWSARSRMNYSVVDKKLSFLDSAKSELIQIADLCAYNILRQARDSWSNFDIDPLYDGYKRIMPIMHRDYKTGKICRYGAVTFP